MKRKGFTLIELLVVIAIIGILASIVIASLNQAREKGQDASARGSLSSIRNQAEIFYDDNSNSYNGVCDDSAVDDLETAVAAQTEAVICADDADGYRANVTLNSGAEYCVDSSGFAGTTDETTTIDATSDLNLCDGTAW